MGLKIDAIKVSDLYQIRSVVLGSFFMSILSFGNSRNHCQVKVSATSSHAHILQGPAPSPFWRANSSSPLAQRFTPSTY